MCGRGWQGFVGGLFFTSCSCADGGGGEGDWAKSLMDGVVSSGGSCFASVPRGVAGGEGLLSGKGFISSSSGGGAGAGHGQRGGQGVSSSSLESCDCHLVRAWSRALRSASASVSRGRWVVVGLESAFGGFVGLCRGFVGVAEASACLASQAALAAARWAARSGWLRSRVSARLRPRSVAFEEGWISLLPLPLLMAIASRCCCCCCVWWWRWW